MTNIKTVGILGGMGPEASLEAYKKAIKYCQQKYNAVQDYDFPTIIIYNLPLHDFDETGITNNKTVLAQLVDACQKLKKSGCKKILIACNTVHHFYNQIQNHVDIPVINLVEEVVIKAKSNANTSGLLCSESTNKLKLYHKYANKHNLRLIEPNQKQQGTLNQIILKSMQGKNGEKETHQLLQIAEQQRQNGAENIILGCTELPLALKQNQTNIQLLDSLQIGVEALIDYAFT